MVMGEKSTDNVIPITIERLTTCKFFPGGVYGRQIAAIGGSFCFSHQHDGGIPLVATQLGLFSVTGLQHVALTFALSH